MPVVTHNVSQSPSLPKYTVLSIKFWHFIAAYQLYLHKCINDSKQLTVLLWFAGRIRYLSRDVRKPDFRICENKDADQRLCFRYLDSTIPLLPKYKISSL